MLTLPIPLLISWLISLFSLALLAGSALFLYGAVRRWLHYDRLRRRDGRDGAELSTNDPWHQPSCDFGRSAHALPTRSS